MTTRFNSLTIVLEKEIREDDAEHLINAIKMLRGVLSVEGDVIYRETYMAEERALHKLRTEMRGVLFPDRRKK